MKPKLLCITIALMCGVTVLAQNNSITQQGDTLNHSSRQINDTTTVARQSAPASGNDDDWVNDSLLNVFDNIQLKDVEVTAQRQLIKQEVDRIGYNVAEDADSKTNNVLTMLRKVPLPDR